MIFRRAAFAVLGALGAIVCLVVPSLGSDPWAFVTGPVTATGPLAPLVRWADGTWDLGIVRSPAIVAGLVVGAVAVIFWRREQWSGRWLTALTVVVVAAVLVPATLLQVALRDSTAPWFHVNDSTYQIELAGDLILDGRTPYGADYDGTGLERFYSLDGSPPPAGERRQAALDHFAYFPGTALTAAAWRLLPAPLDDYRLFVLLATFGCFAAVLLFPAPLPLRLAVGAGLAASPLLARAAWFGTADAPSLLCLLLAFALLARRRLVWAAALLAAAVLLKQFALVAVPFVAVAALAMGFTRRDLGRAAAVFGVVLVASFLPFVVADAAALWDDTIAYGADTYRILGYGLSAILLNLGVLDDRFGPYPFAILALVVWLPVTAWLLVLARRSSALWEAAAGFAISMFLLLFIARVFQTSYLVWPLAGIAVAALLATQRERGSRP